mgnify:CR=1 FL=1
MQSNPPISCVTPCTSVEGTVFYKFPGNHNLWKKGNEWYSKIYNMSKAFRGAEQYLICAESALRKSEPNLDLALHMLNELREARGASSLPDNLSKDELIKVMEEEWVREFVGEGFRLDCLKRWHKGFKRMEAQNMDGFKLLLEGNGYQNLEITPDNFRFVWEIPMQDLQSNPNLKRNWQNIANHLKKDYINEKVYKITRNPAHPEPRICSMLVTRSRSRDRCQRRQNSHLCI